MQSILQHLRAINCLGVKLKSAEDKISKFRDLFGTELSFYLESKILILTKFCFIVEFKLRI